MFSAEILCAKERVEFKSKKKHEESKSLIFIAVFIIKGANLA
jgi:hypothetical protein